MIRYATGFVLGVTTTLALSYFAGIPTKLALHDRMQAEYVRMEAFKQELLKKPGYKCRLTGDPTYCPDPPIRPYYRDIDAIKQYIIRP